MAKKLKQTIGKDQKRSVAARNSWLKIGKNGWRRKKP